MTEIKRRAIAWDKTAKNLKLLRCDNLNLRRNVCRILKYDDGNCSGECETCRFDMDDSISQAELAKAFCVSESVVVNWENCKSRPNVEDLLFYSTLSGVDLMDILVFEN